MIRCPVCEHVQAAAEECALCGKRFARGPAGGAAPVAALEGLELTRVAGPLAVPVQAIPELELTHHQAAPPPPLAEPMPGLEPTAAEDTWGWEEAPPPVPELDVGRVVDAGPKTAAVIGPVMCRYCRNVQSEGLICERCGMRLPRTRLAAPAAGAAASGEEEWVRCPACAVPVRAGRKCQDCGISV